LFEHDACSADGDVGKPVLGAIVQRLKSAETAPEITQQLLFGTSGSRTGLYCATRSMKPSDAYRLRASTRSIRVSNRSAFSVNSRDLRSSSNMSSRPTPCPAQPAPRKLWSPRRSGRGEPAFPRSRSHYPLGPCRHRGAIGSDAY
jgi:hypothetical protein